MTNSKPEISIVVPLYNEEEGLQMLVDRLNAVMDASSRTIEVVLINDGSKDKTGDIIRALALSDRRYRAIMLSRNFGHQLALSAGMEHALGTKAIFIIDGDLQDPPELLDEFYAKYEEGYDVVYAIRKGRKESRFKKAAYFSFYRMLKSISKIDLPVDSGDFSLISREVVDVLNKMPEESRYIRGMRSWVGFRQVGIEYERAERQAGESKYSFKQLLGLAYNGIFNFSEFPVKILTWLGVASVSVSLVYLVTVLIKKFFFGGVPEGFTALLMAIILFSGVQLISLGIIGEYVLRIFFQVKKRPLFLVREIISAEKQETVVSREVQEDVSQPERP